MLLPILFGALLCYFRPHGAWLWIVSMFLLPAAWLSITTTSRAFGAIQVGVLPLSPENPIAARQISFAIAYASLVVTLALSARLAEVLGLIDEPFYETITTRGTNLLAGIYFIIRGNRLPKVLMPMSDPRYDPAAMPILQRRTGWIFVLSGLAYSVIWLVLPTIYAAPAAVVVMVGGVLVPAVALRAFGRRRRLPWRK
jgi:hypothetical protein